MDPNEGGDSSERGFDLGGEDSTAQGADRPSRGKKRRGQGAMDGELFLASVGGCFMSNLLAAITARGAAITGAKAEVTGILLESPARDLHP
jgi:organic hydroperoxide reductase OsmC/OhrA